MGSELGAGSYDRIVKAGGNGKLIGIVYRLDATICSPQVLYSLLLRALHPVYDSRSV